MFLSMLQNMGKLNGSLQQADLQTAIPTLFDFTYINKTLNKN